MSETIAKAEEKAVNWANTIGHFMVPTFVFLPVVMFSMATVMHTTEITKVFNSVVVPGPNFVVNSVSTPGLIYRERRFPYNGAEKSDEMDRIEHNGILTSTQAAFFGLSDVLVKPTGVTGLATQPPAFPNSAGHLFDEKSSKQWRALMYVMYGVSCLSIVVWYVQVHMSFSDYVDTVISRVALPVFMVVNAVIMSVLVSDISTYQADSDVTLQGIIAPNVNDTFHGVLGNGTAAGFAEQSADTGIGFYFAWVGMLMTWIFAIGMAFAGWLDKLPADRSEKNAPITLMVWRVLLVVSVIIVPFVMQSTVSEKLKVVTYTPSAANCPVVASVQFNTHSINVEFTLGSGDNSSATNSFRDYLQQTTGEEQALHTTTEIETLAAKTTMAIISTGQPKRTAPAPTMAEFNRDSSSDFSLKIWASFHGSEPIYGGGSYYYVKFPIGRINGTLPECTPPAIDIREDEVNDLFDSAPGGGSGGAEPGPIGAVPNIKYAGPICNSGGFATAYLTSGYDAAISSDFLNDLYVDLLDPQYNGKGLASLNNATYDNLGWEYIRTVIGGVENGDEIAASSCPYSELGLTYSALYKPTSCDGETKFCNFAKSGFKVWQFIVFILMVPFLLGNIPQDTSDNMPFLAGHIGILAALLVAYIVIYSQFHAGLSAIEGIDSKSVTDIREIIEDMTGKTIAGAVKVETSDGTDDAFNMETTAFSFTIIAAVLALFPPFLKMVSSDTHANLFQLKHHMDSYNAQMW